MPDTKLAEPQQPTDANPTPPAETPPSQRPSGESVEPAEAPAAAPRSLRGAGLRYSDADNVPDWARGKTADEILEMTQQLYNAVITGNPPTPPTSNPAPTPQAPSMTPPSNGAPPQPDHNLMYSDPAEYQRQLFAYNEWLTRQSIQQASAPFLQSQAQIARNASRSDPEYSDVWSEYAPEIDALMASLPVEQRANPQMWNQAAEMVAGRHRKELARKLAERLAASPSDTGTISTDGVGDSTGRAAPSDPIDRLFSEHPEIAERYRANGVDAAKLRSHLATMGRDPAQFVESLLKREVIHG